MWRACWQAGRQEAGQQPSHVSCQACWEGQAATTQPKVSAHTAGRLSFLPPEREVVLWEEVPAVGGSVCVPHVSSSKGAPQNIEQAHKCVGQGRAGGSSRKGRRSPPPSFPAQPQAISASCKPKPCKAKSAEEPPQMDGMIFR